MHRLRSAVTILALTVAGVALPTGAALADPADPLADLQADLATCTGSHAVALTQDLSDPDTILTINCDVVLDLAGHDLTVASVRITGGRSFELTDPTDSGASGTLTANATNTLIDPTDTYHRYGYPGVETGGPLITSGYAHLVATGGWQAAGVGGRGDTYGYRDGGFVTARDHSTIRGQGSSYGAGIGGGASGNGGSVHAEDFAQVVGVARDHAAGIGSGYNVSSDGGTVIADDDSTVAGYGVEGGAGIGTAYGSYCYGGITVVVNDRATVIGDSDGDRDGYGGGAGIGTGEYKPNPGSGASVTVNDDGTLIARGSQGGSAIGMGNNSLAPTGTFLTVNGGTVRLQSDLHVPATGGFPGVVVNGGRIVRDDGTTAGLTGTGTVQNDGAITVPTDGVQVDEVTRRHTEITFDAGVGASDPDPVTVFADTFRHGDRTLPVPTRRDYAFTGWVTGPDDDPLTADTDLTALGSSTDGTAVPVSARATWKPAPVADPSVQLTAPTVANATSATRGTSAPIVGDTLTASLSPTTPIDATVTYAWQRTTGGTTTPITTAIPGATGSTYRLTPDDLGATITVIATGTAPFYTSSTATSAPTGPVGRAPLTVDEPTLTNTSSTTRGTTAPAVGDVLAAAVAATRPAGATVALAWQRTVGGSTAPIAGAVGSTYRLTPADLDATISVIATATLPAYDEARATSDATGAVRPGRLRGTPRVSVTGHARAGRTLTATFDPWSPTPTVQWLRDGTPIPAATGRRYRLIRADRGHRITAEVTFSRAGYLDRTRRAGRDVR